MKDCLTRKRRTYYAHLSCEDCGRSPAAIVTFWVSGMRYRVCSTCVRAYRGVLLKPCSCELVKR